MVTSLLLKTILLSSIALFFSALVAACTLCPTVPTTSSSSRIDLYELISALCPINSLCFLNSMNLLRASVAASKSSNGCGFFFLKKVLNSHCT